MALSIKWNYLIVAGFRSSRREVFYKKGILRNFCKIHRKTPLPETVSFCKFIKKESLAQLFFCEICKISKNTFFYRTPLWLFLRVPFSDFFFFFCITLNDYLSSTSPSPPLIRNSDFFPVSKIVRLIT